MLIVSDTGVISLTRGDTAKLTVDIKDDNGNDYTMQKNDILTLVVKQSCTDPTPLIEKELKGDNHFCIKPEDTKNLAFGKYRYDVQIETAEGEVYTIINNKVFVVLEEVA